MTGKTHGTSIGRAIATRPATKVCWSWAWDGSRTLQPRGGRRPANCTARQRTPFVPAIDDSAVRLLPVAAIAS